MKSIAQMSFSIDLDQG